MANLKIENDPLTYKYSLEVHMENLADFLYNRDVTGVKDHAILAKACEKLSLLRKMLINAGVDEKLLDIIIKE